MIVINRGHARLLAAATIGTLVEWYEFFIFSACAVLVFDKLFFPFTDRLTGIILGLTTYSVGFLARPLGGVLFGRLGDRFGRKKALVFSFALMGVATFCMGLLPTYGQVGPLAPLLLGVLRVAQGIAVGGEAVGALLIVAESVRRELRGFWTSFPMTGGPAGNVLAALTIGSIRSHIGESQFVSWGWRVPFLLSIVLALFGYWVRKRIDEPSISVDAVTKPSAPICQKWNTATNLTSMGQVLLTKMAETTLFYLLTTFFLLLTKEYFDLRSGDGLNILFWASLLEIGVIILAGRLSDEVGRRPTIVIGLVGGVGSSALLFSQSAGSGIFFLTTIALLAFSFHGMIVGGMSAFFTELFPTSMRYTMMSVSYQVAAVVGGSIAPVMGAYLLARWGTPFPVAIFALLVATPAVACVLMSRETKGRDLRSI